MYRDTHEEMLQVWIILSVISNVWCVRYSYESGGIAEFTEFKDSHAASSCEWKVPPENANNYMLCALGECEVSPGIYSKNGTIRITRCNPHYTLIQGYERDVCNNGEWSSSEHECVRCGSSPRTFDGVDTAALIINGHYSFAGDFPWMAAIFMSFGGDPWKLNCGGTLISPNIVLTAAHCLDINGGNKTKPEEIQVGLGRLSLNYSVVDHGSIIVSAKDILVHEKYVGQNRHFDLDIGLIVLAERVPINDFIMPACIDWSAVMRPKHNEMGVLAGWGLTEDTYQSKLLKWTYQKYIDYQECHNKMNKLDYKYLSPDKFCADEVQGGTADHGDSGGGLTFVRNGIHYVYGIVSTKVLSNSKQLRLFTNIMNAAHQSWLREEWRKLQVQPQRASSQSTSSARQECNKDTQCPDNKRCVGQTCLDLCPSACGTNSVCRMTNHLPVCSCPPGYIGNPFDTCTADGKGEFLESKGCRWLLQPSAVPSTPESCSLNQDQRQPGRLYNVTSGEFPYLGIIGDERFRNRHYGVLISEQWFLSTASCYSSQACNKKVRLGISDSSVSWNSPRIAEYDIIEEHLHPEYKSMSEHNIGLFKLNTAVTFTRFIRPVCFVSENQPAGTEGIVIGKKNGALMKTTTDILTESDCSDITDTFSDDSMLCVNVYRTSVSLRMYAGFPMMGPTTKPYCMDGLLALATFGRTGHPEGYMRLSYYLPWIESIIRPTS